MDTRPPIPGCGVRLLDRLWDPHIVRQEADGRTLLFVDRHLLHDGSFQAFARLREKGLPLAHPELSLATPDHYAPTASRSLADVTEPAARRVLTDFALNTREYHVPHFALGDGREGIVHVIGPELGFTLPGTLLVCGDSHTSTHGALGALAFGIGASEAAHVLATQCLWQVKPQAMRIVIDGPLPDGVFAKDLVLALIARIGMDGAVGHAVEYAGSTVAALSIEERCTLCNMTIEAGGKAGFVAPDDATFAYLQGRPLAPQGATWDLALESWRRLQSDAGARFDRELAFDAATLAPMVTWGTSVEQAIALDDAIPDPGTGRDPARCDGMRQALDYMGLEAGRPLRGTAIDRVFIGSCTNGRISDLRAAADVIRRAARTGRPQARVPTLVSPGSEAVKRQAEGEGLAQVFVDAGMTWAHAGCSMCVGMNGDVVGSGQRCVSTSNRNFPGRQGRGSRTHLASPATAVASALLGRVAGANEL